MFVLLVVPFKLTRDEASVCCGVFTTLPRSVPNVINAGGLNRSFNVVADRFVLIQRRLATSRISTLYSRVGRISNVARIIDLSSVANPNFRARLLPSRLVGVIQGNNCGLVLTGNHCGSNDSTVGTRISRLIHLIGRTSPRNLIANRNTVVGSLIRVTSRSFGGIGV